MNEVSYLSLKRAEKKYRPITMMCPDCGAEWSTANSSTCVCEKPRFWYEKKT